MKPFPAGTKRPTLLVSVNAYISALEVLMKNEGSMNDLDQVENSIICQALTRLIARNGFAVGHAPELVFVNGVMDTAPERLSARETLYKTILKCRDTVSLPYLLKQAQQTLCSPTASDRDLIMETIDLLPFLVSSPIHKPNQNRPRS